jgi:hypothetical protein
MIRQIAGRSLWKLLIFALAFVLFSSSVTAKRVPPKPVTPVVSGGIRYSAKGDGRDQYVVAEDSASGQELWRVKVFHNRIKFWDEEDVQWVFITNLKLADNSLLVRDERSRCYSVNLRKKHVKKLQCEGF